MFCVVLLLGTVVVVVSSIRRISYLNQFNPILRLRTTRFISRRAFGSLQDEQARLLPRTSEQARPDAKCIVAMTIPLSHELRLTEMNSGVIKIKLRFNNLEKGREDC